MELIKEQQKVEIIENAYRKDLKKYCGSDEIYQSYEIKNLANVHLLSRVEYQDGMFEYGTLSLNTGNWWQETDIFQQNGVIDVKSAVYDTNSNQLDIAFTIQKPGWIPQKMRKFNIDLKELLKEMQEKRAGMP